ncbi:MAG: potassium transporter TrkG, partial [Candidatus Nanohaloarchaea archaeon]
LRTDIKPLLKNSELRTYLSLFFFGALWAYVNGAGLKLSISVLVESIFTSASIISSTGYTVTSLSSFAAPVISIFLGFMFIGGSLGSTTGGVKVFRVKVLYELLKTKIRSYSLPNSAVNDVKIDGEIIEEDTLKTISVLFFSWISLVFLGTVVTMVLEQLSFMTALSGVLSTMGNMGPHLLSFEQLSGLNPVTKVIWIILMVAGRLELLPLLALFNIGNLKDKL